MFINITGKRREMASQQPCNSQSLVTQQHAAAENNSRTGKIGA
jgi:hypothetical protein